MALSKNEESLLLLYACARKYLTCCSNKWILQFGEALTNPMPGIRMSISQIAISAKCPINYKLS